MQYYSLNKNAPPVSFREATIEGQAPDKGLYFPESIPHIKADFFTNIEHLEDREIAFQVMRPYTTGALSDDALCAIVDETINFSIPLVSITPDIATLELFHGPTLAFKDVGARFMSRCLGKFLEGSGKKVTVLVATSGDTGGAVADGFYDVPGVEVVILYPSGKVSPIQEKQLTTNGKNIHALEVSGSFDDCQRMVKEAFADHELRQQLFLTSANSINVARWLPQQCYYFLAYKQWKEKGNPPVICVPSGNFGNICAGLLAFCAGMPAAHFIAACNVNDTIPRFLQSNHYEPRTTLPTLSNAMDVAAPSNFVRVLELFHQELPQLKKILTSVSVTDAQTVETIKKVADTFGYLLDPHGAVGFFALENYLSQHPGSKGFFLETAHPVKFPDAVRQATGLEVPVPASLEPLLRKEKTSTLIAPRYEELRDYLKGKA